MPDQQSEIAGALFGLKPAEIELALKFREGGAQLAVKHIFRPPALEDWMTYDAALEPQTERDGDFERWDDARYEAAELLWEKLIVRCEGYPEGMTAVSEHKSAAVNLFLDVNACQPETPLAWSQSEKTVCLQARRGERIHSGLLHRFRRPSAKDRSRWRRLNSGAFIRRDASGAVRTVIPSHLKDQCAMYDEFILAVEGYSAAGTAPPGRDEILAAMDAWHKRIAAAELFAL